MIDKKSASNPPPSKLLSYLRLFRLPNVFTSFADVAMGFVFVTQSFNPPVMLVCLLLASGFLYTAGMVLNDVYDIDVDREERPSRPIPSGQIGLGHARVLGYGMLLLGMICGWAGGYIIEGAASVPWRSGAVVTLLAACVVLYDAVLKKTPLGPVAMGGCRFFNVLLGMSIAADVSGPNWALQFDSCELLVAGGIGTYIVGVTWFARTEARESNRMHLAGGIVVMALGFIFLALFPYFGEGDSRFALQKDMAFAWPMLLLLVGMMLFRRTMVAVITPTPGHVQNSVKQAIFSLIILDASVCMAAGAPELAIAVVALIVPTIALGKWVYST